MGKNRKSAAQSPRPRAPRLPLGDGPVLAAGLMSGTSADGVDAAIIRIAPAASGFRMQLLGFRTVPYPRGFRDFLMRNSDRRTATLDDLSALNVLVAEFFADAVLGLARSLRLEPRSIGFIGSHGQTVAHFPRPERRFGKSIRSTLQIGSPSLIAKRTGIMTVGDFRTGDVALGGSGAPLVPLCDYLLLRHPKRNRAALNIGGIANITILPRGCSPADVRAFDTGPGNMLVDRAMDALFARAYDSGGRVALGGRLLPELLSTLMSHPYLRMTPPKSTGRESFGEEYAMGILRKARGERPADVVATLAEFTALSVFENCLRHVARRDFPDDVFVSGGGAHNAAMMGALRRYFSSATVSASDDRGIPADAKEAVCFALLAWRTLRGRPGNLPSVTGASAATPLGVIALP